MPWRVCRVLDFEKRCTSVHSQEDVAKEETANHLLSLMVLLEGEIPRYRGYGGYTRHHPGFVEDLQELIQAVRRRIEDEDVWGAYDDWHRFLQYWDRELDPPLWAQVGTVVVEGPGPTAIPAYDPNAWSRPYRHHAKAREIEATVFELHKEIAKQFEPLAKSIVLLKQAQTGEELDERAVMEEFKNSARSIEFDPTKEEDREWAWGHFVHLVFKDVAAKYGLRLESEPQ